MNVSVRFLMVVYVIPLQCFPSAIASHVVAEYPSKSLVSHHQGLYSIKAMQSNIPKGHSLFSFI